MSYESQSIVNLLWKQCNLIVEPRHCPRFRMTPLNLPSMTGKLEHTHTHTHTHARKHAETAAQFWGQLYVNLIKTLRKDVLSPLLPYEVLTHQHSEEGFGMASKGTQAAEQAGYNRLTDWETVSNWLSFCPASLASCLNSHFAHPRSSYDC